MKIKLLILAGLGDSGENHWQTYWLRKFENATKVIHDDWDKPIREDWLKSLDEAMTKLDSPTILVAHSVAVSLVMHWNTKNKNPNIIGALLVAPADVDSKEHTPEIIWNFAPIPLSQLDFPSLVITSDNDPYISLQRASYLAKMWGSEFVNIGTKGHINSESNLEYWEEGQQLLQKLIKTIQAKS